MGPPPGCQGSTPKRFGVDREGFRAAQTDLAARSVSTQHLESFSGAGSRTPTQMRLCGTICVFVARLLLGKDKASVRRETT
jgi:hypothetical protein